MYLLVEMNVALYKIYATVLEDEGQCKMVGHKYIFKTKRIQRNIDGRVILRSDNKGYLIEYAKRLDKIQNQINANPISKQIRGNVQKINRAIHNKLVKLEIFLDHGIQRMGMDTNSISSPYVENTVEMVVIGSSTRIPKSTYDSIDWTTSSKATRGLLSALFPREVLGTHSMTGKGSAAHPDKPVRPKLDPVIVEDIILAVSKRCRVPNSLVRTAITSKCADEHKRQCGYYKDRTSNHG